MSTRSGALLPIKFSQSFALLLLLLAALWIAGGASRADVLGQAVVRAVAWIAVVVVLLFGRRPPFEGRWPVLLILAAALLLALLQLIPLPPAIWQSLPGHAVLAGAAAGDVQPWRPWSMVPGATLNAASSLVVPFAVVLLLAGLSERERALLPGVLLAMIATATLIGLFQFSGAQLNSPFLNDPSLNETASQISGIFANRNHFALFVAIGCLLAPAWAVWGGKRAAWRPALALGLVLLFALTILGTGSRAGMVTGVLAIAIGLWLVRSDLRRQFRRGPAWAFPAAIIAVVGVILVAVLVSVAADRAVSIDRALAVDLGQDMRSRGLPTVLEMIRAYFPMGSGLGGFDTVFRIHEPFALLKPTYFNHAHNDFLEIVLDAGLPGALLLATALGWWIWASLRVWRGKREGWVAARTGSAILLLVLIASAFDYPARTPLIMALIVVAAVWLSEGVRAPHGSALPGSDQHL
jgi:O-antigen ligase